MKKNAIVLSIFAALSFSAQAENIITENIMGLQGEGMHSPYTDPANYKYISDETFIVKGLVTAIQTKKLGKDLPVGFFIQDKDGDGNPKTSEGVFVDATYNKDTVLGLSVGDKVEVTGKVKESYSWTQIVGTEDKVGPEVKVLSSGHELPEARIIRVLEEDENFSVTLERHEGMLVKFDKESDMHVTRTYGYDFGPYRDNMVIANARVNQHPNQSNVPGSTEAAAQTQSNKDKRIIVESFAKAPRGVVPWYPGFGQDTNQNGSADNYIRIGDRVDGLEGVITYSYNDYRLFVTNEADQDTFVREGTDRTEAPVIKEGDISIATFNVLNYFNSPFGGPENPLKQNRGAKSLDEFEVQAAKIVSAMTALDADILGLMEVENNGFGENSAIVNLVSRLNEKLDEADHYSISQPASDDLTEEGFIGSDAITSHVIFKASKVSLETARVIKMPEQHTTRTDDKGNIVAVDSFMRNAVTPTFNIVGSDEKLTIAVNHLKSKGSACWENFESPGDLDKQGSCAAFRVSGAYHLGKVMATIDGHKMIIGDLNSYANEDPIMVFTNRDNAPEDYVIKAARSTYIGGTPDAGGVQLHGDDGAVITESYGYANAIKNLHPSSYSYSYNDEVGTLDYILVSPSLNSMVVDGIDWNINAPESTLFEYPTKNSGDFSKYNDAYRSSDHDPAIVVLNFGLNTDPEVPGVTPDFPDQVELPMDAPATPSGIISGNVFKVSLNLLDASKTALVPLVVGDIASTIISEGVNTRSVKLSNTQQKVLEAADFEAGYVVFEIAALEEGDYTMLHIITDASDKQKFAAEPITFSVADSVDSNVTPEEKSGGSTGVWSLVGLLGFAFLRRKAAK
ncbi:ExeM/NucH family extracellular endonuclease [Psychromonas ossibalaenae]|uniref:ExeM/NucH family extracellular endonuclease n=1 Tax=Psychromonas ossibalaenae TaxID=444922 RepID=UPI0003720628|nr:ExeM/NucH family extracellular endonuclease [Psychromonas ossibalaenae]